MRAFLAYYRSYDLLEALGRFFLLLLVICVTALCIMISLGDGAYINSLRSPTVFRIGATLLALATCGTVATIYKKGAKILKESKDG